VQLRTSIKQAAPFEFSRLILLGGVQSFGLALSFCHWQNNPAFEAGHVAEWITADRCSIHPRQKRAHPLCVRPALASGTNVESESLRHENRQPAIVQPQQ
jgi:hypothetical protein